MPIYPEQCPLCNLISKSQFIDSRDGVCLIEWQGKLMAVSREHTPLDLVGSFPVVAELFGFDFKSGVDKIFVSAEDVSGHGGVLLIQVIFE